MLCLKTILRCCWIRFTKLAVHYEQFSVLAIQSIKELKEKNDVLENRVSALEERLAKMDAMIDAIATMDK